MATSRDKKVRRQGRTVFVVILAAQLLAALVINSAPGGDVLSGEAISRTGVALDLLNGRMKGRQGLVGSLYWAPLPTLLVLPIVPLSQSGFASCIVCAFFAAAAGAFLNAWWRRYGVGPVVRFLGVLLFEAQPQVLLSVMSGTSAILFATLIVACFACLLRWLSEGRLNSLAYLSVFVGLAVLTRYQAVVFGLAVLMIVLVALVSERKGKGYREATLIAFLVPGLYAAAVWFAANWLIMGDPIFFLRGILPSCYVKVGLFSMLTEGCEWPLALFALLLAAVSWRRSDRPAGAGVGFLVLLICAAAMVIGVYTLDRKERISERKEIGDIVRYCVDNHSEDRVVSSGYRGYEFTRGLPPHQRKIFVHRISMYLGKVLKDTRGKSLYILVPKPVGGDRWEDINLIFPGMYEGAPEIILSHHGWRNWRLFRVVRTDA